MIQSFRHKGLQQFFETGSKAGIQAAHANRLQRQLFTLNRALSPQDMNVHGWRLHPLTGAGEPLHWSILVNCNWRITFAFQGEDAILVNYQDYH